MSCQAANPPRMKLWEFSIEMSENKKGNVTGILLFYSGSSNNSGTIYYYYLLFTIYDTIPHFLIKHTGSWEVFGSITVFQGAETNESSIKLPQFCLDFLFFLTSKTKSSESRYV